MNRKEFLEKEDLLADIETTIDRALDEKHVDLITALLRIQASTNNWCEKVDCGQCQLAKTHCLSEEAINNRVQEIITDHHEKKYAPQCVAATIFEKLLTSPRDAYKHGPSTFQRLRRNG